MTAAAATLPADGSASAGGVPRPLAQALAAELVLASRMLADLAYDLGSDGATLRRHMASLQRIDHITQIQLAIADLLRTSNGADGDIAQVTLQDMADRLRTFLGENGAA
ncbi:hypothetical protein GCM10022253_01880 [Sphingomonas endophytica]|uniref:Chemotaxis protein n=1 Tax=Sphingomonas endophytica TaxID=869719 RepID=A0ABR6N3G3_9SPHN|nr:hypothetical protein [Sphingomonas endophytica]MBB5725339.1 hypothetical protein [Sphingomonas endophytica]